MAFTRNFLKSLGLNEEQVQSVMEEHVSVTDALKQYKADAEQLPTVQKELDDLKKATADYEQIKSDLAKEKQAFSDYKSEVENQNTLTKVKDAYKALLKAQKVDDKRIGSILKVTDFSAMKLDKDGKLEKESDLTESIKTEWSDFIVRDGKRPNPVETPPADKDVPADDDEAYVKNLVSQRHSSLYGNVKDKE